MRPAAWIAALVVIIGGTMTFELLVPHRGPASLVDLARGSSRWTIARQLSSAGIIRDPYSIEAWALVHPHARLVAGTYRFGGAQSALAVFGILTRGAVSRVQIVIPEGFNRFDIARELERKGLADSAAFLAASGDPSTVRDLDPAAVSLEGYLFPDTYEIPLDAGPVAIAAMMVARFRQATSHLLGSDWPPHIGPRSSAQVADIHAWVTVASLVEKETAAAAERPVIAGVFFNRLARNLPLQCDPTVIYASLLAGDYHGTIRRADLERRSPFNTYENPGLPPGPIANPGIAALRAALHPAATAYLYFVSNDAGGHRFAVTLAQQKRNVQLYQRAKAERQKAAPGR